MSAEVREHYAKSAEYIESERIRRMTIDKSLEEGVFGYLRPDEQHIVAGLHTSKKTLGELALELDKPARLVARADMYAIKKLEKLLVYGPDYMKILRKRRTPMGRPRKTIDLEKMKEMDDEGIPRLFIAQILKVSPSTITRRLGIKHAQMARKRTKSQV